LQFIDTFAEGSPLEQALLNRTFATQYGWRSTATHERRFAGLLANDRILNRWEVVASFFLDLLEIFFLPFAQNIHLDLQMHFYLVNQAIDT